MKTANSFSFESSLRVLQVTHACRAFYSLDRQDGSDILNQLFEIFEQLKMMVGCWGELMNSFRVPAQEATAEYRMMLCNRVQYLFRISL